MDPNSVPRQAALDRAHEHAVAWLDSLDDRPVPPAASADDVAALLGADLPDGPTDPVEVIDLLAARQRGRAERDAVRSLLRLRHRRHASGGAGRRLAGQRLGPERRPACGHARRTPPSRTSPPRGSSTCSTCRPAAGVGFVTGATMANFTCLASARDEVLRRAGWDPGTDGLHGAPPVRVLVGEERHDSVDLVLRYLGLGRPEAVAVDDQGRVRPDALAAALASGGSGPTIVALQAGNVHSGAFDPFPEAIRTAHEHDAWVHVDGAFGLFAAASARCGTSRRASPPPTRGGPTRTRR